MLQLRASLIVLVFCLLPGVSRASAPRQTEDHPRSAVRPVLAVADLSGPDQSLGRFLADTLLTDLAQSEQLRTQERAEIDQAFTDLNITSATPLTPQQVRQLGRQARVDRLIVGSYLEHDSQMVVNIRMLDTKSGLVVSGGALNLSGDRHDLLDLSHRLSRQLHKRVTGTELDLESASMDVPPTPVAQEREIVPAALPAPSPNEAFDAVRHSGLLPANVRPNGVVTERDLADLVRHVAQRITPQTSYLVTVMQPTAPVSRIRALTALVRLFVSPEDLDNYRTSPPDQMPSDAGNIPMWGLPFTVAALDQGWWRSDRPLRARENATWTFVGTLLSKMLTLEPEREPESPRPPIERPDNILDDSPYTGLIIDARDFRLQRAMGPRILDEDGHVLYPDPKHVPDLDYLEDHGMASYVAHESEATRAGKHPLIVRAIDVITPGHDDMVVSNETAERIREANRRDQFLLKWNVSILSNSR
jgi:TolB-like protein